MFKQWNSTYKEITRIKKDRFLKQALIDGDDFFEIQVCKTQSGISELVFAASGLQAKKVEGCSDSD